MFSRRFVAYYRASTDRQGNSGLGLEAQQKAVRAVAQHEREMISERTRAALQAAKARGQRLGNPNLPDAAKRAAASLKAGADQFAANVLPIIRELQGNALATVSAIAAGLNARKVLTRRGGQWTHVQVASVLARPG